MHGQIETNRYQYVLGTSSVNISHHQIIILSTSLYFFRVLLLLSRINLKKDLNHFGISLKKFIDSISINCDKKDFNQGILYAETYISFPCCCNNLMFHNKINSSHIFLYDQFHINKTFFHSIFNCFHRSITFFSA
jgi:hypothetical protein